MERYRRNSLRDAGLFDLAAVYDYVPENMAKAAEEEGAAPCASYEELLDFPGLEGIVISTGAKFHAEQALAAAERGLHVFVEKPLCATPEEMHALLEAAQAHRRGHRRGPCGPQLAAAWRVTIQRLIDTGELGSHRRLRDHHRAQRRLLMKPDRVARRSGQEPRRHALPVRRPQPCMS